MVLAVAGETTVLREVNRMEIIGERVELRSGANAQKCLLKYA